MTIIFKRFISVQKFKMKFFRRDYFRDYYIEK